MENARDSQTLVTRLENVADLRRWAGNEPVEQLIAQPVEAASVAKTWRPSRRPSMAIVFFSDDSGSGGETVRVRSDVFTIGRTEGDFRIPHDDALSGRHVELLRDPIAGSRHWVVRDLASRNGTFARISSAQLADGAEVMIGTRRLKFELPTRTAGDGERSPAVRPAATQEWTSIGSAAVFPTLRDLSAIGRDSRLVVNRDDLWIGSDVKVADLVIQGDPFICPKHARLHRDKAGSWWIENRNSRNGTWLRIERIAVERTAEFQVGEQRFSVKVLDGAAAT